MADHLDAPGLTSPDGDSRVDITDIYAFQKPGDSDKSILAFNVNPIAPTFADSFRHGAAYDLFVDTDGDAEPDLLFRTRFSAFVDGAQSANVYRYDLSGRLGARAPASAQRIVDVLLRAEEAGVETDIDPDERFGAELIIEGATVGFDGSVPIQSNGDYQFFAGIRSDPFFFDLMGFMHNFAFTGTDFFIDKNVFAMVLEVPNWALGPNPNVGLWGRTLASERSHDVQVDRMGRPAINTVFNKGEDKDTFNSIQPSEDRALFLDSFVHTLETLGGYSPDAATGIAEILLPDILTYDYTNPAGFLNGRKLTDDVIDIELALVTNGAITGDGVGVHGDLLNSFPYMGPPH